MRGQTAADSANAANTDNYFSNMAPNLTNFGTNVQGIGRNVNEAQANQDNIDMVGLATKNNIRIARNRQGKLVILNS